MSLIASDHFRIVVGLGKSGMSLVRFLASRGVAFAVADTRENPPELATLRRDYPQVEVRCGELDVEFLCRADELYVSPGLALATPALQAAAARGVKLSGDIELFARNAKAPIVAISGSNAKSTVTTLVGEMAAAAGKRVAVGGNLGTPALSWSVVSSWKLESSMTYSSTPKWPPCSTSAKTTWTATAACRPITWPSTGSSVARGKWCSTARMR